MSEAPRAPVVLIEEGRPAARLDFGWDQQVAPLAPPPAPRRGPAGRVLAGAAVLGLGLAGLSIANFVDDQFGRGVWQGYATLAVVGLGGLLLLGGLLAELRGLLAIRAVDRARAAFARGDLRRARAEAVRWAGSVAEAAAVQPALREVRDIGALRALLAGPAEALAKRSAELGRAAALQAFAATAISPSPGLDALIFAWRGVRLVRQVAALHGLRPGLAGTIVLLRRVLVDAATVAITDVALDAATRALLTNPLLAHLAGEAGAGAVAARRMLRLSRVAAEACRVVPEG